MVGRVLRDPVRVHVLEEIVPAERLEESANARAIVSRDDGAIRQAIGGVWRRHWVVLAAQIAVLGVSPVAGVNGQSLSSR